MAGNWKGAHPPRQPSSPSLDPNQGLTSRSVDWKGGNSQDITPKPSPMAPIPGRINLPSSGSDE